MTNNNIKAFAIAPIDAGSRNQILGAFRALNDLTGEQLDIDQMLALPEDVSSYLEIKNSVCYSKFKNYKEFKQKIFERLDAYFAKVDFIPQIFMSVYNSTESNTPGKDVDKLCCAVKEYYSAHNLGKIMTVVLTSRYYKYKYVDLINIPKHLMTFSLRIRLLRNKKLRKNVLITIGTINNFNNKTVKEKFKELNQTLKNLKDDPSLKCDIAKYETYKNKGKKIVFLLGGRVEGSEIVFDIDYAQKLYNDAARLANVGFGVAIINGPRTPNNVTDFLYEKSKSNPDIIFQNSKRIAQMDEDRAPSKWRIYSGKHEDDFNILAKIGNIYPGILGYDNTLVVHSMDSYSCCETAGAAIPTAISTKGIYVDPVLRYDCQNLVQLMCPKYAIDFDDFVNIACNMKIEPKDLRPQVLSSPLRVFAETIINRYNQM